MKDPVGTVKIRTRWKRGNDTRAWVKIAEPNVWKPRAIVVWETAHGPLPRGMVVHHKDENTLNDALDNLEALTKAKHLKEHRPSYENRRVAASNAARRRLRWSTKSKTKITGRPTTHDRNAMAKAVAAVAAGTNPHAAALKFGVPRTTLYRKVRNAR